MCDKVNLLLLARIARQMSVAYENGGFTSAFIWYFFAFSEKSKKQNKDLENCVRWNHQIIILPSSAFRSGDIFLGCRRATDKGSGGGGDGEQGGVQRLDTLVISSD